MDRLRISAGRTLAAVLGVLLVTSPAWADSKVKGKVVDGAGNGVAEAQVTLTDDKSGRVLKSRTGKDGSFYQRGVLPATYTLKVEKEGYTPHIVETVRVQAGVDREFPITLRSVAERQAELRKEQMGEAYGAGYDAFQKGDFEAALARADEALAKDPGDIRALDMKAKALVELKRYAEAVPLLEKELELAEPPPGTRELLGKVCYNAAVAADEQGRVDDAIALALRAREQGNESPQVDKLLGRAYLQKGDFHAALPRLQAYLEKAPDAADAAEIRQMVAEIQKLGDAR